MDARITRLERSVSRLRTTLAVAAAALGVLVLAAFSGERIDEVLRVRGLVIVDDQGRDRILLGAPVPESAHRVRTDLERVRALWGPRFPESYMEYYEGYDHGANGLVILDEKGFDRLALGDPVPDPNIGQRIGASTGIVINDAEGFERSGYGLLDVDGRYRVILGLDSARGTEAVALGVFDEGPVGAWINDGERALFLGTEGAKEPGAPGGFHGLRLEKNGEVVDELNVADDG